MAAPGKFKAYDFAKKYLADGTFDLDDTTNWKAALFLSTSNANTLSVGTAIYGDLTNEHANANGYLTGGVALTGITWTRSGATLTFDAADLAPAWTAAGGSIAARFLVIYKNATVNTIVKPLLCVCLMDTAPADVTVTDTNPFNLTFNASGILTLTGMTTD
jgi:hypothetical protein